MGLFLTGITFWFIIKVLLWSFATNLISFVFSGVYVQRAISKCDEKSQKQLLYFFKKMNAVSKDKGTKFERKIAPALIFFPGYAVILNLIIIIFIIKDSSVNGYINAIRIASKYRIVDMGRREFCKSYLEESPQK